MMHLRDALNDYKIHRGDRLLFPGERRTTTGLFSGFGGRLVHIDGDGSIRDFSYPLVGLTGIALSRFGVCLADGDAESVWFNARNSVQRYYRDTALVVTRHETSYGPVVQYDLTLDDIHVTHFDVSETNEPLNVVVGMSFAPDGRDTRIAQLHHGDTVEVYHARETDYLASATGFTEIRGSAFGGFAELLDSAPASSWDTSHPSEEDLLGGDVVGVLSPENGTVTLATLLTTRDTDSREDSLGVVRAAVDNCDAASLERLAEQHGVSVDTDLPHNDAILADIRVLSLLTGQSGLRIAGPDFDPYFAHSGGYGYSWFRDDAEISKFLLDADRHFDLGLSDWHERSAKAYTETQLSDGTWPHRVWSFNTTLAPGWANDRITNDDGIGYQADQTASVASYLAARGDTHHNVLKRTLSGLDDSLADDGRPVTCQNAWEDMSGRFTHTTATFLEAYSRMATTGIDGLADRASARATEVYDAVDDLWVEGRCLYALREYSDDDEHMGASDDDEHMGASDDDEHALDERCDSATFALVSAHRAYARIGEVDENRLDRLVSHVETTITELQREPTSSECAGLIRYEGDRWRCRDQTREKIWTVSTAWGAYAAGTLAVMLADRDDERAEKIATTARDLLGLILPGGPLCLDNSYLPEQVFDDGTPDSATPLGWPHAIRLATIALLDEHDMLKKQQIVVDE